MSSSRKEIATDLFAVSRTVANRRHGKSAKLAALILSGQWNPPAKDRRPEGYTCLGLIRIQDMDEWREVRWVSAEAEAKWMCWNRFYGGGGEVFPVEPKQFAPLPVRVDQR